MFPGDCSSLRRTRSGVRVNAVAEATVFISFVLLLISGALNVSLLATRLVPALVDQAESGEADQLPPGPECPNINCSAVCARAVARDKLTAREAASRGKGAAGYAQKSALQQGAAGGDARPLEDILLFIGALSGRGYRHRRLAVRDAWSRQCQVPGVSVCRFILSDDEVTPLVEEEMEAHKDIVLVHGETTYKSILLKSIFVLEYAVTHYDVRFVLKTDDDAYVNVRYLVAQLRLLCESPDCRRERLYMGRACNNGEVITAPGHKWNNEVYKNHTGLDRYVAYMLGGGYIMSADVVKALMVIKDTIALKHTPIEDATIGMWLTGMDLRAVDHPRINTNYWPCCFKEPVRGPGEGVVTGFELTPYTEMHICTPDPWIILHKLDSPTKMRYIGQRFASCGLSLDEHLVPASIAPWVARIGATESLDK